VAKADAERQAARRRKLQREGARQILVTLPRPAYDRLRQLAAGRTLSETIAAMLASWPG
jgi:predicted DNA-binding ribbon-helix-helix protein